MINGNFFISLKEMRSLFGSRHGILLDDDTKLVTSRGSLSEACSLTVLSPSPCEVHKGWWGSSLGRLATDEVTLPDHAKGALVANRTDTLFEDESRCSPFAVPSLLQNVTPLAVEV